MQEFNTLSKTQIAQMYGIDRRTLDRWLQRADPDGSRGIRRPLAGRFFTPTQVKAIIEHFGNP